MSFGDLSASNESGIGASLNAAAPAQPGDKISLDFQDQDEARHRAEAVRNHLHRTQGHLIGIAIAIAFVALAPVFWRAIYSAFGLSFDALWTMSSVQAGAQSVLNIFMSLPVWAISLVVLIVTLGPPAGFIIRLSLYRWERDRDWRVAESQAGERDPTSGARGYMQIFRLYARTKRRSTFTLLFGAAGLWWTSVGIVLYLLGSMSAGSTIGATIQLCGAAVGFILWLVVIYFGFDVGRRYLPGRILVTKTLILSVLATTSQTDYTVAREAARELEAEIVEDKPWWFYSYRKKPKRYG